MSPNEINTEFCRLIGLDPKTTVAINVKIRIGSYPVICVQSLVPELSKSAVNSRWTQFELIAKKESAA